MRVVINIYYFSSSWHTREGDFKLGMIVTSSTVAIPLMKGNNKTYKKKCRWMVFVSPIQLGYAYTKNMGIIKQFTFNSPKVLPMFCF